MKARYDSREPCWLCGLSWARGDAISKWLGDWVHEPCKAARAASVASEGVRAELPEARGWVDMEQTFYTATRPKAYGQKLWTKIN
jgi:hypothetical protein